VLGDEPADHFPDDVKGQGANVRGTAGQRNNLRPGGDGEESSDLGGNHALSPGGILIHVGIHTRALALEALMLGANALLLGEDPLLLKARSLRLLRIGGHGLSCRR
jgi:hypothetical protein